MTGPAIGDLDRFEVWDENPRQANECPGSEESVFVPSKRGAATSLDCPVAGGAREQGSDWD